MCGIRLKILNNLPKQYKTRCYPASSQWILPILGRNTRHAHLECDLKLHYRYAGRTSENINYLHKE
jgi:hypothetical protein